MKVATTSERSSHVIEQRGELDPRPRLDRVHDARDALRDRNVAQLDVARRLVRQPLQHRAHRLDQIEQRYRELRRRVRVLGRERLARRAKTSRPRMRALAEFIGGLAIALIFEQPLDQVAPQLLDLLGVAASGCGSSANDLMSSSVAAITRYSPAMSRLSCPSIST